MYIPSSFVQEQRPWAWAWAWWLLLGNVFLMLVIPGEGAILSRNSSIAPAPTPPTMRDSYPYYVSASVRELHEELYNKIFQVLLNEGVFFNGHQSRAESPFRFKTKSELRSIIDFSLPHNRASSQDDLVAIIQQVIQYSPHPSHPYKVDRHGAGLDPYGLVGDWMGSVIGSPVVTYLVAPVIVLMEYEIQKQIRTLVYGREEGDGMMTPGVAAGSSYAIQMALRQKFPDLKQKGFIAINSPRPVLFVSEQGSFFYERYASWEGLGENGVIRVATCKMGRMDVADLRVKIQEAKARGEVPFMVVGTAGTPILGAIDPLEEIATVATENGLWFHVQGFLAGSVFLSETHKHRIKGVERSDSFLWSANKGLAAPHVSTVLVTTKTKMLDSTFSTKSDYLYHKSPLYDTFKWDNGDGTMQCSRRPYVFKLWFMWKSKGQRRLGQHVDYTYATTRIALSLLEKRSPFFTLVLPDFESHQIAFHYTPSYLQGFSKGVQRAIIAHSKYTERLKAVLLQKGILSISVNTLPNSKDGPQFFVMNLGNSVLTEKDVAYILDQIAYQGESLHLAQSVLDEAIQSYSSTPSPDLDVNHTVTDGGGEGKETFWNVSILTTVPIPPPAPTSPPDFVSAPIESMHKACMLDFFKMILKDAIFFEEKRQESPHPFLKPEELLTKFDFSLSNPAGIGIDHSKNGQGLMDLLRNSMVYSGQTGHPFFMISLIYGLNPYTLMAEFVTSALNTPMTTYEDNPVFAVMQEEIIKAVAERIGFPPDCEGLFLPGGSAGNELAIHLAYLKKNPEAKVGGVAAVNKTMVAFMSSAAHYSSLKGTFFSGLGLDNMVPVAVDKFGRMSILDLRAKVLEAIVAGKVPFLVTATSGTTVLGAFDPLDELADVCKEFNMWLHVDAAYGGSMIMSPDVSRKGAFLKGVERVDSFTFNPHKVISAARTMTVNLIRQKGILDQVSPPISEQEFNNEILYNGKKDDLGRRHFFPDRRENVFKIWFLWKAIGIEGFGEHVEFGFNLTDQVYNYIQKERSDEFILAPFGQPPNFVTIILFYVPPRHRHRQDRDSQAFWDDLGHIQTEISRLALVNGRVAISAKPFGKKPPFLMLPLYNSALSFEDAKYVLDVIDFYGRDL